MASITRATSKLTLAGFIRKHAPTQAGAFSSLLSPSLPTGTRHFSSPQPQVMISSRSLATAMETYYKQKQASKDLRTERYNERLAHKETVKRRRDGKPKNVRKKRFLAWYKSKVKREMISDNKARKLGMDWKLQVAVVLERIPVVLPDKPQWQGDYDKLRAYLDQFGREYPEELSGSMEIEEIDDIIDETDEESLEKYLPRGFKPAPRVTEADQNGDVRTLDRRLKTWVYLSVKDSVETPEGEKSRWQLPTVDVKGGETMLEAAQRAIREKIGGDTLDIYYPSNCPMTVDLQEFKEEERAKNGNTFGIKTFFMVVQYDDGKVSPDDIFVDDFAWLEKSELVERIREEEGEDKSKLYYYLLNDNY